MNADVIWSEILDRLVDDVSYSWAEMVFGRMRDYAQNLEGELDATRRELERWKTGTQVEGDYVTMRDQIDLLAGLLAVETERSEKAEALLISAKIQAEGWKKLVSTAELKCLNCGCACIKGQRFITGDFKVYCSFDCAETDGEDWAQK